MNIDPRNLTVKAWCDAMVQELRSYGTAPQLVADDWVTWGKVVVEFPGISRFSPPRPEYFVGWQDWAQRFNQAVIL